MTETTTWFSRAAERQRNALVFTPLAWLKMQFLCHAAPTEVSAFAVLDDEPHEVRIVDLLVPKQECSYATTDPDMADMEDLWDGLGDGVQPWQYSSVWCHTHPHISANPSMTDEGTFEKMLGPWAVMFILSKMGETYARLKATPNGGQCGPVVTQTLPVEVDWSEWPADAQDARLPELFASWAEEVKVKVTAKIFPVRAYEPQGDFTGYEFVNGVWQPKGPAAGNGDRPHHYGVLPAATRYERDFAKERQQEEAEWWAEYEEEEAQRATLRRAKEATGYGNRT